MARLAPLARLDPLARLALMEPLVPQDLLARLARLALMEPLVPRAQPAHKALPARRDRKAQQASLLSAWGRPPHFRRLRVLHRSFQPRRMAWEPTSS